MKIQTTEKILTNFPINLGKVFAIFLFLTYHCFFAQIYLSDDTIMYVGENTNIGIVSDTIQNNNGKVSIYVRNSNSIIAANSDEFDIIETEPEYPKENDQRIANQRNTSEIDDLKKDITSSSEADEDIKLRFSFQIPHQSIEMMGNSYKNISASVSTLKIKFATIKLSKKFGLVVSNDIKHQIIVKSDLILQNIFLKSYSVRPPPRIVLFS